MIDRVRIEKESAFVGRESGFQMEFDMRDAEGRRNGIKYACAFFIPLLLGAGGGYIIGLALGSWIAGTAVGGTIGILATILTMVNMALSDREKNVTDNLVTYYVNTQTNTFEVKDAYGRDVTQYYGWRRDWTSPHRYAGDALMKFHVKKITDFTIEQPELVDENAVQREIDELRALRLVIWGIVACFTFIPFIPLIIFAQGEKRYPDTSYFRKDGSFTYKGFGIAWSVICLLAEIAVVVILSLVG